MDRKSDRKWTLSTPQTEILNRELFPDPRIQGFPLVPAPSKMSIFEPASPGKIHAAAFESPSLSAISDGRNQELQPHGLHKVLLADIETDEL